MVFPHCNLPLTSSHYIIVVIALPHVQEIRAPVELVRQTKALGRLPVVNFAAGGVATPADAALMMQLGMDGVFVGSGIFKSGDPAKRARAIVQVRRRTRLASAGVMCGGACAPAPDFWSRVVRSAWLSGRACHCMVWLARANFA